MHHKINDKAFKINENIPALAVVYSIIALDEYGIPVEINRFLDIDQSGTLYIGKSDNLRKRINNMRRAFSKDYKSEKHVAVRRYNILRQIEKKFPIERLVISFELAKKGTTARQLESHKLNLYEKIFGERPPLNRQ